MIMSKQLEEIKKALRKKSNKKVKISCQKFVPTSQKVYGVRVPELNKLAARYKSAGFELVEELWNSGAFEEKLLASKILGKICKKDPERTLKIIEKFSKGISDWAVCDTLATQGIREIAGLKQEEILETSKKLIRSKNPWERRFAIVLLINLAKDRNLKKELNGIMEYVKNDNEHYVKKAVEWLKRKLK